MHIVTFVDMENGNLMKNWGQVLQNWCGLQLVGSPDQGPDSYRAIGFRYTLRLTRVQ